MPNPFQPSLSLSWIKECWPHECVVGVNGDVVVTAREIHAMDEERLAVHVHRVRVGGVKPGRQHSEVAEDVELSVPEAVDQCLPPCEVGRPVDMAGIDSQVE